MQLFKLLAPAALVALASAQFYEDDEQFEILAREEAPGYDDLGVFIRDNEDKLLDLETREAEPEAEETELSLLAREADQYGDYDSIISLAEREADPEAEAFAEAEAKKKKKKSKKNKKRKGKGKKKNKKRKGKGKNKKGKGKKKNRSKSKKKASKAAKAAKEDAEIWGL